MQLLESLAVKLTKPWTPKMCLESSLCYRYNQSIWRDLQQQRPQKHDRVSISHGTNLFYFKRSQNKFSISAVPDIRYSCNCYCCNRLRLFKHSKITFEIFLTWDNYFLIIIVVATIYRRVSLIVASHKWLFESVRFLFSKIPQTKHWMWFLIQKETNLAIILFSNYLLSVIL